MDLRELQDAYRQQQREVTDERMAVGALIRTVLSEADGLTFKDGRKEKPKRLVVIGVDRENALCFGSLNDADREGIFDILETSDIFSTKQKKRYGIRRC